VIRTKPILFSGPMIRALLDGCKTQTRRVLREGERQRYAVGDKLWVKEEWSGHYHFRDTPPAKRVSFMTPDGPILREDIWYWADGRPATGDYERPRSPLFMPRWASRITLEVTAVRVQRLQEISDDDALAEGVTKVREHCYVIRGIDYDEIGLCHSGPIAPFAKLWDSLNAKRGYGWEDNPWVAAISFRIHKMNVDAFLAQREAA